MMTSGDSLRKVDDDQDIKAVLIEEVASCYLPLLLLLDSHTNQPTLQSANQFAMCLRCV